MFYRQDQNSNRFPRYLILSAALLATAQPALADRFTDSRLLASQCSQCHGTNGVSAGGIDSLAGSEYQDLLDKMLDMSRPGETGDIMKHQAKGYTTYQMMLIAEYFSQLSEPQDD
jgi:sulfide dehydrogenase cytochrome subunit